MKKIIIFLLCLLPFIVNAQGDGIFDRVIARTYYIGNSSAYGRYLDSLVNGTDTSGWQFKNFSAATTSAIYNFVTGRLAALGAGGTTEYAWQGLSKVNDTMSLGSVFGGDGAPLFENRYLNLNRKVLSFGNGFVPASGDERYTPFQITQIDTVATGSEDYDVISKAAFNVKRIFRYAPGVYTITNRFGSRIAWEFQIRDSAVLRSNDGDYNAPLIANGLLSSEPGYTGVSTFRSGHTGLSPLFPSEASSAFIAKWHFNHTTDAGTDNTRMKFHGFLSGINSYFSSGNTGKADSLDYWIYYKTGNYINAPFHLKKSFVLYPTHNTALTDSSFFLYDRLLGLRSYHSGNLVIGFGPHSSYHQLMNNGTSLFKDSIYATKRIAQTDTTGIDFTVRLRSSGLEKHIAGGLLNSIIGSGTMTGTGTSGEVAYFDGANSLTSSSTLAFTPGLLTLQGFLDLNNLIYTNNAHGTAPSDSVKWAFQPESYSAGSGSNNIVIQSLNNANVVQKKNVLFFRDGRTSFVDNMAFYGGNYGAVFNNRSLVDKGYVDSVAALGGGGAVPELSEVVAEGGVLLPGQIIDFGSTAFAQFTDGNTGFDYYIAGQNGGVAIGDIKAMSRPLSVPL